MYDPSQQHRCVIIRGKTQQEMEDILSCASELVYESCFQPFDSFRDKARDRLAQRSYRANYQDLPEGKKKTIDNYFTEIITKLFCLYRQDCNENEANTINISPSCSMFLVRGDMPAFFKNLCLNFQFPNGMQKYRGAGDTTIETSIDWSISSKPLVFIVALLDAAKNEGLQIRAPHLYYFVLNSLHVLQGVATVSEVLAAIRRSIEINSVPTLPNPEKKKESYVTQHLREQLNLLKLANIIRISSCSSKNVYLNIAESTSIELFLEEARNYGGINFPFTSTMLGDVHSLAREWERYYGSVRYDERLLLTPAAALQWDINTIVRSTEVLTREQPTGASTQEIGNEGERIVLDYERARLQQCNSSLVRKLKDRTAERGIGYDIESVDADENPENSEHVRFIEVKTTKRTTSPVYTEPDWTDSFSITRNEWLRASQFCSAYYIYRVVITPGDCLILKIKNLSSQADSKDKRLQVTPINYKVDIFNDSIYDTATIQR